MDKLKFLIFLIILSINSHLIVSQNQEISIKNEKGESKKLHDIYRIISYGLKPFPSEEEKESWNKKNEKRCGATWLANFSDFYATESEEITIVLLNSVGYYKRYSIEEREFILNISERELRVKHYVDFDSVPVGCDGCIGSLGISRDTLYLGKLPKGDYTIIQEKYCSSMEAVKDSFYFTINGPEPEEEVAKIKKQKILEQIPENTPPQIRIDYTGKFIFIQYILTEAEKVSVELNNLSGTEQYILKKPSLPSRLGYNELRLPIPEEFINRDAKEKLEGEEWKAQSFKIIIKIGDEEHESSAYSYSELKKF